MDEVPVHLDLLRADLYRLLDEMVRARPDSHLALAQEFERAWERFRDATALRAAQEPAGPVDGPA
jgi:hypothetical protein